MLGRQPPVCCGAGNALPTLVTQRKRAATLQAGLGRVARSRHYRLACLAASADIGTGGRGGQDYSSRCRHVQQCAQLCWRACASLPRGVGRRWPRNIRCSQCLWPCYAPSQPLSVPAQHFSIENRASYPKPAPRPIAPLAHHCRAEVRLRWGVAERCWARPDLSARPAEG